MIDRSSVATFERLNRTWVTEQPEELFETACVIGGSIAGLLAARVLADHARNVVIIERDQVDLLGKPRSGVPQDRHGHVLLPGGLKQLERWFRGLVAEAVELGGYLAGPSQQVVHRDGRQQVPSDDSLLLGSRPFLETRIRSRVLALPNVCSVSRRATGLAYDSGDQVCGVYCDEDLVQADFVVDATGRASKLSAWLDNDGYERPRWQRVRTGINYATALFKRSETADEQEVACVLDLFSPQTMPFDLTVAHLSVIEDRQWLLMLMSYDDHPASKSIEAFRSTCAGLSPIFEKASRGLVSREIRTYHQADSRRRDFTGLSRFPARLVAVGDAVASFNPIYGQGISSAALHASCLAEYLTSDPDLNEPAAQFFDLQQLVVDAAWALSAGGDAAREDVITGAEVSEETQRQRWALQQIMQATLVDAGISEAFNAVTHMEAHPDTLADSALLERAIAVNRTAARS